MRNDDICLSFAKEALEIVPFFVAKLVIAGLMNLMPTSRQEQMAAFQIFKQTYLNKVGDSDISHIINLCLQQLFAIDTFLIIFLILSLYL